MCAWHVFGIVSEKTPYLMFYEQRSVVVPSFVFWIFNFSLFLFFYPLTLRDTIGFVLSDHLDTDNPAVASDAAGVRGQRREHHPSDILVKKKGKKQKKPFQSAGWWQRLGY